MRRLEHRRPDQPRPPVDTRSPAGGHARRPDSAAARRRGGVSSQYRARPWDRSVDVRTRRTRARGRRRSGRPAPPSRTRCGRCGGPTAPSPPAGTSCPLRLFLGVTFLFAGLQKLANPDFFQSSSPISIHAQLVGADRSSPIHALLTHLVPIAPAVGLVIALGEVAIGLGILVGLWTRVAAVAGMALSFGLFLTVSFHSSPYFTGSDIVFLFAWTPLALAGRPGPRPSTPGSPGPGGRPGAAPDAVSRRAVLSKGALTGVVAGAYVVLAGRWPPSGGRAGAPATTQATNTLGGGGDLADHDHRTDHHHDRWVGRRPRRPRRPPRRAPRWARPRAFRSVARPPSPTRPAATPAWSSSRRPTTSWPSTPSAPTPAARWPTRRRPRSSPVRATAPSSTPRPEPCPGAGHPRAHPDQGHQGRQRKPLRPRVTGALRSSARRPAPRSRPGPIGYDHGGVVPRTAARTP